MKKLLITISILLLTVSAYAADVSVNRVHKIENPNSKLVGFADITVNDIIIRGMRIVNGRDGLFVSVPQRRGDDGEWYPLLTIQRNTSDQITKLVVKEYNNK